MPKQPLFEKDNLTKRKINGKTIKFKKRKKIKLWNFKDSNKSENTKMQKMPKNNKLSKANKLSLIKLNLDKLIDSEPNNNSKDKPKF